MESVFQFSDPALLKLDFITNGNFKCDREEDINLNLKIETQINKEEEEAFVVLCVTIGEKTDNSPFYIYAEQGAGFRWEKDTYDEVGIDNLLTQNAPALLISYLRPIIVNITGSSPYGAYHIPFLNFRGNKQMRYEE